MTTATTQTANHIANRAPKGGMVSSVNGRYYKGGQFVPCLSGDVAARFAALKPAPLVGSSRQVAWANRLRAEALARKDAELAGLLFALTAGNKTWKVLVKDQYRDELLARHAMLAETSAAAWINAR